MFFDNKLNKFSIDRIDNSFYNLYRIINFYGMFYLNTKKYLIISLFIYFFLSFYYLGFIIIFFLNLLKWKNNNRNDKLRKNLLKKNEIIKEEFYNELWWCRAELNIQDIYGYLIKDFNNLIKYLNLLKYYDLFNNNLVIKKQIIILNNNLFFYNNLKINKNFDTNYLFTKKDKNLLNTINKLQLVYKKKNIINYLNNNYLIINYLDNNLYYNNFHNNFCFLTQKNKGLQISWWNWFNYILK